MPTAGKPCVLFKTLWNLYEILDAQEFRSEELKKPTYENLNFKYDKFGMQLIRGHASEKVA